MKHFIYFLLILSIFYGASAAEVLRLEIRGSAAIVRLSSKPDGLSFKTSAGYFYDTDKIQVAHTADFIFIQRENLPVSFLCWGDTPFIELYRKRAVAQEMWQGPCISIPPNIGDIVLVRSKKYSNISNKSNYNFNTIALHIKRNDFIIPKAIDYSDLSLWEKYIEGYYSRTGVRLNIQNFRQLPRGVSFVKFNSGNVSVIWRQP